MLPIFMPVPMVVMGTEVLAVTPRRRFLARQEMLRRMRVIPVWVVVDASGRPKRTRDNLVWWFLDQRLAREAAREYGGRVEERHLGEAWEAVWPAEPEYIDKNPNRFHPGVGALIQAYGTDRPSPNKYNWMDIPVWLVIHGGPSVYGGATVVADPRTGRRTIYLSRESAARTWVALGGERRGLKIEQVGLFLLSGVASEGWAWGHSDFLDLYFSP
ncbi:MAG: hypothetical protein NZ482_01955 [Gloeomargarita sp. SKYG98]|nr:hypothetical protein [Gloeomargarita sp. SKYG98]